jgi:hypothetical protein
MLVSLLDHWLTSVPGSARCRSVPPRFLLVGVWKGARATILCRTGAAIDEETARRSQLRSALEPLARPGPSTS